MTPLYFVSRYKIISISYFSYQLITNINDFIFFDILKFKGLFTNEIIKVLSLIPTYYFVNYLLNY